MDKNTLKSFGRDSLHILLFQLYMIIYKHTHFSQPAVHEMMVVFSFIFLAIFFFSLASEKK